MKLNIKDARYEKNFRKIFNLYKKSFPKQEIIKSRNFHQYAFKKDIFFRTFYDKKTFVGFVKGYIQPGILYISFLALANDKNKCYETEALKYIKSCARGKNLIIILRDINTFPFYEKLGFKLAKMSPAFASGGYNFLCTHPNNFDEEKIVAGIKKCDWPMMFKTKENAEVYYANISKLNVEKTIKELPNIRKEKAEKLIFEKDKKLSIGVYLLLKKALAIHKLKIENFEFMYDQKGKPFLKNCPYSFSLSHSGEYVMVGLSKFPIGVDIQETKKVDPKVLKFICNDSDLYFYNTARDKDDFFYQMWTSKEAILKLNGNNLSDGMKNIVVNYLFNFAGIFLYNFDIVKGYKMTVASNIFQIKKPLKIEL